MSGCMNGSQKGIALPAARTEARKVQAAFGHRGVGMLEFLIALLIFSTGMLGLLSAQLVGKRAGYEALQRSVATALARDILERMRANPGHLLDYQVTSVGDASHRLLLPPADCYRSDCSTEQLALFDLWQWESLLLGESERDAGFNTGGLVSPRACITTVGGVVEVAISWLGATPVGQPAVSVCGSDDDGDPRLRSRLTIATFIGER